MGKNKLFLCGFSGAGKTTLGDRLSKSTEFQVLDLDEEIFNRMGSGHDDLGEYIEEIGIEEFRKDELDMLKLLDQNFKENYLIILGGGALETREVREFITEIEGTLIYLDASFEECWSRLKNVSDRPLVKKGEKYMKALYDSRVSLYREAELTLSQEQAKDIFKIEDLIKLL